MGSALPSGDPMESTHGRAHPNHRRDQEFARDPIPARAWPAGVNPIEAQRVVVNPFLGVGCLVFWAWLTHRLYRGPIPPLSVLAVLSWLAIPHALQFHCVDCGETFSFPRWRAHLCPNAASRAWLRIEAGRPLGRYWPSARVQLYVWGYLLGSVALLGGLLAIGTRAIMP